MGGTISSSVQGTRIVRPPNSPSTRRRPASTKKSTSRKAVDEAKDSDVVVLCLGEGSYTETPGNITDLTLLRNTAQIRRSDHRHRQAGRARDGRGSPARHQPYRRPRGGNSARDESERRRRPGDRRRPFRRLQPERQAAVHLPALPNNL
jgi:hypothetical protein